jgi:hypothetical protein
MTHGLATKLRGDIMFPIIDKQRTGERIRKIMKQQNITVKQVQEAWIGCG